LIFMADLASDIRLAVDSGEVALGVKEVSDSIKRNKAQLVVAASKGRLDMLQDVQHVSKVAEVRLLMFEGDSMALGRICGKPYSVSVLSIINPGNSKILEEAKV
jgi:large subunit ribosomal protein L30e